MFLFTEASDPEMVVGKWVLDRALGVRARVAAGASVNVALTQYEPVGTNTNQSEQVPQREMPLLLARDIIPGAETAAAAMFWGRLNALDLYLPRLFAEMKKKK